MMTTFLGSFMSDVRSKHEKKPRDPTLQIARGARGNKDATRAPPDRQAPCLFRPFRVQVRVSFGRGMHVKRRPNDECAMECGDLSTCRRFRSDARAIAATSRQVA